MNVTSRIEKFSINLKCENENKKNIFNKKNYTQNAHKCRLKYEIYMSYFIVRTPLESCESSRHTRRAISVFQQYLNATP